jgi:hypothetical protein
MKESAGKWSDILDDLSLALSVTRIATTSRSLNPAASRCSASEQIASYSRASGTRTSSVILPCRAVRRIAADAPLGLRIAATITSVSATTMTSAMTSHRRRCYPRIRSIERGTRSSPWTAGLPGERTATPDARNGCRPPHTVNASRRLNPFEQPEYGFPLRLVLLLLPVALRLSKTPIKAGDSVKSETAADNKRHTNTQRPFTSHAPIESTLPPPPPDY